MTARTPLEDRRPILMKAVADAIQAEWAKRGEVPFPLYDHEAEALAKAAVETYERWR